MASTDVHTYHSVRDIDRAIEELNNQIARCRTKRAVMLGFGIPMFAAGAVLLLPSFIMAIFFSLLMFLLFFAVFLTQTGFILWILGATVFGTKIKNRKRLIARLEERKKDLYREETPVLVRLEKVEEPVVIKVEKPLNEEEKPASIKLEKKAEEEDKAIAIKLDKDSVDSPKTSTSFHYVKGDGK